LLEDQGGDAGAVAGLAAGDHLGISLSKALFSAGRAAEAGEVMQELVLLQPDNAAFYFYLGNAAYNQKKYGEVPQSHPNRAPSSAAERVGRATLLREGVS
jgi:hypothetical protein